MGLFGSKKSRGVPNPDIAPTSTFDFPTDDPVAAIEALQRGELVPSALRRLAAISDSSSFTSDLSINEFTLLKGAGFNPICQVAGTAVYKIGYQAIPYGGSQSLATITEAFNEARRLAIGRLQQEAHLAKADAVVGARITQGLFDAEGGLIEFSIVGTAVKNLSRASAANKSAAPDAALTTLNGQDLYLLSQNGYRPVGLVGASSCYLASLSPFTFQQMYSMFGANTVNFEIAEFTNGYYSNRRIVMREIERSAKRLGASGIIDFNFSTSTNSYNVPGGDRENVGAVSFLTHVLATAIVTSEKSPQPKPLKMLLVNP